MGAAREHPTGGALAAVLAVAGWLVAHPVAAQQVTYNGSLTYSTGAYVFEERTHSLWLSSSVALEVGRAGFVASLPVILQNSQVVSFVAGQPLPTGGEASGVVAGRARGRQIGSGGTGTGSAMADSVIVFRDEYEVQIGDPILWGSLELLSGRGRLRSLSLQASAKPPLRSLESGVGTGAWDFGGGASLLAGLGGTLVLLDGAYWSFGDLPDLELSGSFLYSAGLSRPVMGGRGSILVSLYGATSIIETVDSPLTAGVSFLYSPAERRTVFVAASVGLSEASPDFAVSLGWGVGLH